MRRSRALRRDCRTCRRRWRPSSRASRRCSAGHRRTSKVSDSGMVNCPNSAQASVLLHGAVAGRNARKVGEIDRLEPVDVRLAVVGTDDPRPPERIVRRQPDLLREVLHVVEREVVRADVRRGVDVLALPLGEVRVAADRRQRRIAEVPVDRQGHVVRLQVELRIDARLPVVDVAVVVEVTEPIHAGPLVHPAGDDRRADVSELGWPGHAFRRAAAGPVRTRRRRTGTSGGRGSRRSASTRAGRAPPASRSCRDRCSVNRLNE